MSRRAAISAIIALLLALPVRAAEWASCVPAVSAVLPGYADADSVKSRLASAPLHHIEGLWRFAGDQALVAIEQCDAPAIAQPGTTIYRLVIVSSPRKGIEPGTLLGYAAPAGAKDTYDARLYTSKIRSLLRNHASFTLKIDSDDAHLSLTPARRNWKLLLRETFHFLVRIGLYHDPGASDGQPTGFTRVYPSSTGRPVQPVYL